MKLKSLPPARLVNWCIILINLIVVLSIGNFNRDKFVIAWDVFEYYSYLPARFVDDDPYFKTWDDNPRWNHAWPHKTEDGGRSLKMSSGMSIMYSPFFLLAHGIAKTFNLPATGFSPIYKILLQIGCLFYFGLGLFFVRKILEKQFSQLVIAATLIVIAFGTNLLWYTSVRLGMTHPYSFALFAGFLYFGMQWLKQPRFRTTIIIGVITGLITLIRPTNLIIVSFLVLYGVSNKTELVGRFKLFLSSYQWLLLMIGFCLLVWVPQIIFWKETTGHWWYYSYQDERFFFTDPKILKGLFGFRNGWLIYTPVMIFALVGIPILYKKYRQYFMFIIAFTVINTYIILSWWCWWYVGTGHRAFIESYALLSIPLAAFFDWVLTKKNTIRIPVFGMILLFTSLNIFQVVQSKKGVMHSCGMTKDAYFAIFGKLKKPHNWDELVKKPDFKAAKLGIDKVKEKEP